MGLPNKVPLGFDLLDHCLMRGIRHQQGLAVPAADLLLPEGEDHEPTVERIGLQTVEEQVVQIFSARRPSTPNGRASCCIKQGPRGRPVRPPVQVTLARHRCAFPFFFGRNRRSGLIAIVTCISGLCYRSSSANSDGDGNYTAKMRVRASNGG